MAKRNKTVIVGAGPVGSLAALYAAIRGDDVKLYDIRSDPRIESSGAGIEESARAVSLILSERGINAIQHTFDQSLIVGLFDSAGWVEGTVVHGPATATTSTGPRPSSFRTQRSISSANLCRHFLNRLAEFKNVSLFFEHKLVHANLDSQTASFQKLARHEVEQELQEQAKGSALADLSSVHKDVVEVQFDFIIGADGANSMVRHSMMRYMRMSYEQQYVDTLWWHFEIPVPSPSADVKAKLMPNRNHIWRGPDTLLMAVPNQNGSFSATLYMPMKQFRALEEDGAEELELRLLRHFNAHYPGLIPEIVTESWLADQFRANPRLPLVSLQCSPYNYGSRAVLVGDAAHAMMPFYWQGLNAGLEDVRLLYKKIQEHTTFPPSKDGTAVDESERRARAFDDYSKTREQDAFAITRLSMQHYQELMGAIYRRRWHRFRVGLEEVLAEYAPWLGWKTQYWRVTYETRRYSQVEQLAAKQKRILGWVTGTAAISVVFTILNLLIRLKTARPARTALAATLSWSGLRLLGIANRLKI